MSLYKLGTAISFFVMSGAMLSAQLSGRMFPGLPVGIFVAIISLVGTGVVTLRRRNRDSEPRTESLAWYVLPIVAIAVIYRSFVFSFPASYVGVDPPGYGYEVLSIVRTANIYSLDIYFYSEAPLGLAFPAMLGMVAGGNSQMAMSIYPLFLGILTPVTTALISQRISTRNKKRNALLAAGLGAVATASAYFAFWTIPQSLGVAYWLLVLLFISRFIEDGSKPILFLATLTLIAQVFTHKLPLLIIFLIILGYAVSSRATSVLRSRTSEYTVHMNAFVIAGIALVLLLIQWVFVTNLLETVVIRSQRLLSTDTVTISPPQVTEPPTDAAQPVSGLAGILLRQGYWLALMSIGGVAWLTTAYRRFQSRAIRFLLVSVAIPTILLFINIAGIAGVGPNRINGFIEPALIPLLAISCGALVDLSITESPSLKTMFPRRFPSLGGIVAVGVVLLLISTQVFNPVAIPDFPESDRDYTTEEEVSAKMFGYQHINGVIHIDWFGKVSEGPECMRFQNPPTCRESREGSKYPPIGTPFLNANVTGQGYEHVLYRKDVVYYRTARGIWRLLWDPERSLDTSYNRVYANGGAIIYNRANVTT